MTDLTPQAIIVAGVADIVHQIAGIPLAEVQPWKSFADDLDVDSLTLAEVIVAAEERFGVKIPHDRLTDLKTVGDLGERILGFS